MIVKLSIYTSAGPEPLDTKPIDLSDASAKEMLGTMIGSLFLEGDNFLLARLVNETNGETIRTITIGEHDPVLFKAMNE